MTYNAPIPSTCFICKEQAVERLDFDTDVAYVQCVRCGNYQVTHEAQEVLRSGVIKTPDLARLSSVVRLATESQRQVIITKAMIQILIESSASPPDPMDAADAVLLHLLRKTEFFGSYVSLPVDKDYPLFTLRNPAELNNVVHFMEQLGWITVNGAGAVTKAFVLPAGYVRRRELSQTSKGSNRAFVAMSFDPKWDIAYKEGIKPAILESGFVPVRVDEIPHNERIDDRIIRELRGSVFVVCDFSSIRSGVFFEAGFGLGLGLPVIWTCQAASFDELSKHFDTRQFNHVVWGTPQDLRERLINRILATIPSATRSQ